MTNTKIFKKGLNMESTLPEALSLLSVNMLKGIIYFMKLENTKENSKKGLIKMVSDELPAAVGRFIKSFDTERYELCKKIIENKGILFDINLPEEKVLALTQIGIIYPVVIDGRNALFMPKEIISAIEVIDSEELKEIISYNTDFINKIHGMLFYYGYLTLDDIFQFTLKRKAVESIENLFFLETIYMAVLYYGQIKPDGIGFRHKNLMNCSLMLELQETMSGLGSYKILPKEKYQQAGSVDYMEWTSDMKKLKQFILVETLIDEREAESEIEEAWYDFNNGVDLESVCIIFIEKFFLAKDTDVKKELISKVVQMFLTMPNWLLKGYSFEEIIRLERVAC